MAGLDHYPFAVFIHIVGALGLFATLALEWLAVTQLRRATTASESSTWLRVLPYVRRIGPPFMAVIVVPGVAMALTRWNFLAWPAAALLGMAGMIAASLLLSRRPTQAALSVELRIAIALGIVALMVFKPDLWSSLLVLVGAAILGTGASIIARSGGTDASKRLQPDTVIARLQLETISGERVRVPDDHRLVHLQFRRFAGCPVCNLHLRSTARRHAEIVDAGIREVVVFHSSREALLPHAADLPFAVVADPGKQLYVEFGVESSARALLDPRAWLAIVRGVARSAMSVLAKQRPVPALNPEGGRFGLPADFLIARDGRLVAVKYGSHADDQWSVDELLALAQSAPRNMAVATPVPQLQAGV
jgi:peroxiredoxin